MYNSIAQYIKINGKEILCHDNVEWEGFKKWVEGTSLFNAIKNDPHGTQIVAQDGSLELHLNKSILKVEKAEDLPIEVLHQFYLNSPWKPFPNQLQKMLTNDN